MGKYPFLSIISNTQEELSYPTYEESREYQAKLMGLREQQQRVLGYTESTIALGINCLYEFLDVSNKFIWEVDMLDADKFYLGLVGRGLAYSTRRKYQSTISSFLEYLKTRHGHEIWEKYRVQVPNLFDKFNRYYHRKDDHNGKVIPPRPEILERFWDGLKHEMKTARKYSTIARDYTIFRMLELTGLRTYEIIMMDVKDCRFDLGEKGKIHVRFGKGSKGSGYKRRWVPMLDGVDLLTLKELLGHADVATTFNYSNPGSDHLEKRVRMAQEKWKKQLLNFIKEGE